MTRITFIGEYCWFCFDYEFCKKKLTFLIPLSMAFSPSINCEQWNRFSPLPVLFSYICLFTLDRSGERQVKSQKLATSVGHLRVTSVRNSRNAQGVLRYNLPFVRKKKQLSRSYSHPINPD